ncbi:MAG: hypothetical protein FGM39_12035 [Phycisphaerales bacterium]|nr:hypothetical protein [Phycisphaerales bacterium]
MDESRTARPNVAATLDHRHLVPPTLRHLCEHPGLASILDAEVTTCLARRARFPHTLLVGPADSSKRAIIATVAAELDVPVTWTDAAAMSDCRELDRTLRRAAPGSIVAITGADDLDADAWTELARIAATREPPRLRGYMALMHEMELEPWQRTSMERGRYPEFTFMLTSRRHVATTAPSVRWVERQWFVPRSKETESVRLRRLFRAAAVEAGDDAVETFAQFAPDLGMRTLGLANALVSMARAHGDGSVDAAGDSEHLERTLAPLIDPRAAIRLRRRLAREAKRAAAATATSASGTQAAMPSAPGGTPTDAAAAP